MLSGSTFQENVAAWFVAHLLGEQSTSPGFGLADDTVYESIHAESRQPVDDLRIQTSAGGHLFVQAKNAINGSARPGSPLASAVDQFVRQIREGITLPSGERRSLDPTIDRLLLIAGDNSAAEPVAALQQVVDVLGAASTVELLQSCLNERNTRQRAALESLRTHFERSWSAHFGLEPRAADWLGFLQLVRIRRFSLTPDGGERRSVDLLLRESVLDDPTQAGLAWSALVGIVRALGPQRAGIDRPALRAELAGRGLSLRSPRSFRDDVEAVRRHSEQRLDLLGSESSLPYHGEQVRICRPVADAIAALATDGDLIVTGAPGSGKSACLFDLTSRLLQSGANCVFLEAERIDASTLTSLSLSLGIKPQRSLIDLLTNWPLTPHSVRVRSYLVIDALDAARGQWNLPTLCDLIRQVRTRVPNWTVVVSMREFDLRHAAELRELFDGSPHAHFRSAEFDRVRHIHVPGFNDSELEAAICGVPPLRAMLERGGIATRELVRNPFSLRILVELLDAGCDQSELADLQTQVELLDRFWEKRIGDTSGVDVEAAAANVWSAMKSRRALSVPHSEIAAGVDAPALSRLLQTGILRSEPRSALAGSPKQIRFSHNILFDYAGARLWAADLATELIAELEDVRGHDLAIYARPSLVLAFQRLWCLRSGDQHAPEEFWSAALTLVRSQARLVAKIVPAGVAVGMYRDVEDLRPLLDRLTGPHPDFSEQLLGHLIGALLSLNDSTPGGVIVGPDRRPWLAIASELTRLGLTRLAWRVAQLLFPVWSGEGAEPTDEQQRWANSSARTLLGWAADNPSIRRFERSAVGAACRTIGVDPSGTIAALQPLLEPTRSEDRYTLLQPMADHVVTLAAHSPRFAARVITAAFRHEYAHDDRFTMGDRLLTMTLSKADSLGIIRRELATKLNRLVNRQPRAACFLLVRLVNEAVAREHQPLDRPDIEFSLLGERARLRPDYSSVWGDRKSLRHNDWIGALNALARLWRRIAADDVPDKLVDSVIRVFARHARVALLWKSLMRAGASHPDTIGRRLVDLLIAPASLAADDTHSQSIRLITAVWPQLSRSERLSVEAAILALTDTNMPNIPRRVVRARDRLLAAIPADAAQSAEARAAIASFSPEYLDELLAASPLRRLRWNRIPDPDDDSEAPRSPQEQRLRELRAALKTYTGPNDRVFTVDEVAAALDAAEETLGLLEQRSAYDQTSERRSTGRDAYSTARDAYFECIASIARCPGLADAPELYDRLKVRLLAASFDADPLPPPADSKPDHMIHWGCGEPRIEAAIGLVSLARHTNRLDSDQRTALLRLSRDPHRMVRFQVTAHFNAFWHADRDFMWEIVEEAAQTETDLGVLRWIARTLRCALLHLEPARVDRILTDVQARVSDLDGEEAIAAELVSLLLWRHEMEGVDGASHRLDAWLDDPLANVGYLNPLVAQCRRRMVVEVIRGDRGHAEMVRRWTFEYLRRLVAALLARLAELAAANGDPSKVAWPDLEQEKLAVLYRLADHLATQVFFASGAHDAKGHSRPARDDIAGTEAEQARFYREAIPLLEILCDCPIIYPAYRTLETLAFLMPQDPANVFRLVHRCLMTSSRDAVQFESMVADKVVALIERYLAEHRGLLRDDHELRAMLLDILDLFVAVGWPKATQLAYRLDEVFR